MLLQDKKRIELGELWNKFCDEGILREENRNKLFLIEPVSPETFFAEWLKPSLSPLQLDAINSVFRLNDRKELGWNDQFQEYLLLWGEGSGKDFLCSRILIYCAYWMMCLRDPQEYFGLAAGENIDMVNVSVNSEHARDIFFYKFTNALKQVINPETGRNWFEEQGMDLRDGKDIQTTTVKFKNHIRAHSRHSERYAGEGMNVLMAVFDEVGEFKVEKAKKLYEALWHTETSRYGDKFKLFLISYMRDPYDFMMYRWEQTKTAMDVYRSKACTWEVNPLKRKEDFKKAYEKNPEDSARRYENRDLAGSGNRFFRYKERIVQNVNTIRHSPINAKILHTDDLLAEPLHMWFLPRTVEQLWLLQLKEKDGKALTADEKQIKERLTLQHQDAKYFVHIDLAKANADVGQDCAGFAMTHTYPINPYDEDTETGVFVDLAIQLRVKGGELDFEMIRKFIYKLQNKGFPIVKATLDGYQSVDFIQRLKERGIESETLSVDKTTEPYNTLKEQIYTKQLDYYYYKVLVRELEELQLEKNKVDHPEISYRRAQDEGVDLGSKDVADAVAGAVYSALENEPERSSWFSV